MKILNRAKHLYSDEYIISDSIKFMFSGTQMYLYDYKNCRWVECEQDTRSINLSDMLDSEGTKIFASLSEDGNGGDNLWNESELETYCVIFEEFEIMLFEFLDNKSIKTAIGRFSNSYNFWHSLKVTGIQQ